MHDGHPEAGLREEMDMNRWAMAALGCVTVITTPYFALAAPASKDAQPTFVGFSDDLATADTGFPGRNLARSR